MLTPGVARTDNCAAVLCSTKWGKDARHVTAAMKRERFRAYGFIGNKDRSCRSKRHFEIDHLISRELCGDDVVENLWPQCYGAPLEYTAAMKDQLENRLHKEVCAGNLALKDAQDEIVKDWRVLYRRYFGE